MKERSLVFFTLASQTAAGIMAWQAYSSITGSRLLLSDRLALGWALALAVAALLGSIIHLGNPLRAVYALKNLKSSWLSREVALAGAFTLVLAMLWLGTLTGPSILARPSVRSGAFILAALLGISLVLAERRVYDLRTAPQWSGALTGPEFFLTGWLLGGVVLTLATILESTVQQITVFNPWFPLMPGLLVGLGLQGLVVLGSLFSAGRRDERWPNTLRLLSLLVAIYCLIFWQILASAILILVAELLGRLVFYAHRSRVGV